MSEHPIAEWNEAASRQADACWPKDSWLWWQEYRHAYADAAGVNDEPAVPASAGMQAYLRGLDEKILQLRSRARNA